MTPARMTRLSAIVLLVAAIAACGGGQPSGSAGDSQVLTGNERFGWDQPAADRAELASFKYAIYVDSARSEALDITCESTRTAAGFPCTCRLPQLTPGPHTLQVAAYVVDGETVRESSRSAPVRVTVR